MLAVSYFNVAVRKAVEDVASVTRLLSSALLSVSVVDSVKRNDCVPVENKWYYSGESGELVV